MSKSLGNIYTLQDILDKGYSLDAFKLMIMSKHYRTEGNFTWDILEAAQNRLKNMYAAADLKHQPVAQTKIRQEESQTYEGMTSGILRELSDDLDTPSALNFLNDYFNHVATEGYNPGHYQEFLEFVDSVLGLNFSNRPDITKDQKYLLNNRYNAKSDKNWAESDRIRDELAAQGIGINDSANGQIWYRL
jgi:cysteinyl-tRNA synthetase